MPISVSLVTILNKRHAYICKTLHLRISSIAIVCVDAEHKEESFDLILKLQKLTILNAKHAYIHS